MALQSIPGLVIFLCRHREEVCLSMTRHSKFFCITANSTLKMGHQFYIYGIAKVRLSLKTVFGPTNPKIGILCLRHACMLDHMGVQNGLW